MEKLLEQLHVDYMVGRTLFTEPSKKYIVTSYYQSVIEYGGLVNEDFPNLPTYYGATIKEALQNAIKGQKELTNN